MFKVFVRYPSYDDEYAIAERTTGRAAPELGPVLAGSEILALQELVRRIPAAPTVVHYALRLARLTRPTRAGDDGAAAVPEQIQRMVAFGAGPRAVQYLLLGGKARAAMLGRTHVATEDIRALAKPVLRHRLVTNYAAEAESYDPDRLIDVVLAVLDHEPASVADRRVEQVLKS